MRQLSSIIYHTILCVSVWIAGSASAAPPKKPMASQFSRLVSNSPFTIQPSSSGSFQSSPLERDWMLGSIRPSGDGWSVTLINKKNRKQRIRLLPGFDADGFKLLDVSQDLKNSENSRVQISKGGKEAWITYDEKLIKVRPSTTAKAAPSKRAIPSKRGVTPIPLKPSASRTRRVIVPKK